MTPGEFELWSTLFTVSLVNNSPIEAKMIADAAFGLWKEKRATVVREKPPATGIPGDGVPRTP